MTSHQPRQTNASSSRPEQGPILILLVAWLILCVAFQAQAATEATTPAERNKAFRQRQKMHTQCALQLYYHRW